MIVVTGAAGRLGRRVVQILLDQEVEVRASDQVLVDDLSTEFRLCDMQDRKSVESLLKGSESVIHMGAIPGPLRAEGSLIFDNNVNSTFNIMMAAADQGLRRVVV